MYFQSHTPTIMVFPPISLVAILVCANMVMTVSPYILSTHRNNGLLSVRPHPDRAWTPGAQTLVATTTTGPPEDTLTESRELILQSSGDAGEESRGHHKKKHHHKKMAKKRMLYPVLIGLFIAKSIIFPMLLKALTIMSSASFMLSKMSLLTSVLLGFKWFLTAQTPVQQQPTILRVPDAPKVEVVHVPVKKYNDWDRENDHPHHGHGSGGQTQSDNYDGYYGSDHEMKPTSYT